MGNSPASTLSPRERTILKLALSGGSVIDWPRLPFANLEEVRRFLQVNEFDPSRPRDLDRLLCVHNESVGYLQRELRLDLSQGLREPANLLDLFLSASDKGDPALQKQACSILKTMNIINHIDGRELLYNCPISRRDLFSLVEDKIERALSRLCRNESLLVKYQGGRKAKESLITKLLCKRETIAAQINDRVRYRLVTRTRADIAKVMLTLFDTILPFNYIIPNASMNQLLFLGPRDRLATIAGHLRRSLSRPSSETEYSGVHYQICKFVVDIPIRMDNFLARSGGPPYRESLGTIAYVLVEFQIVDEETEVQNNTGESSHENYKKRQKAGVIRRLVGS